MKPIILTPQEKAQLIARFINEAENKLRNYTFNNSSLFTFSASIGEKAKEKVKLVYSPVAWLKMKELVDKFSTEVSWFGLVNQVSSLEYYIYDVLVCKQQVSGAKVDTEDEDMYEFLCSLTDEQAEHLHFQAHSHVNMDTKASGVDEQNQMDIISNMPGHKGFYIFQIWNKRGDISTYLYDLDANLFFDKNDVEIIIEGMESFIDDAKKLVTNKVTTYYYPSQKDYTEYPIQNNKKKPSNKKLNSSTYEDFEDEDSENELRNYIDLDYYGLGKMSFEDYWAKYVNYDEEEELEEDEFIKEL